MPSEPRSPMNNMTNNVEECCCYLDWDSNFFGYRIGRALRSRLKQEDIEAMRDWGRIHRIDCVYVLADADDAATVRLAEASGFQLVDVRITLEKRMIPSENNRVAYDGSCVIRQSREDDIPALQAIARASHDDTRFYYDAHFPSARCDDLYGVWIENSCRGYADMVFVAEDDGKPRGYISCHLREQQTGQIGLIAVAANSSGKGIGTALVRHAVQWFGEQGMTRVSVVTQGRNVNAQRLYQKCGFMTRTLELYYHYWLQDV